MKKNIFISIILLTAVTRVSAQPYYTNLDTIPGYYEKYYYSEWYYDCPDYDSTGVSRFWATGIKGQTVDPTVAMFAKQQYTPRPMEVKGLVAMVAIRPSDVRDGYPLHVLEMGRGPEYMKLFQWIGTTDSMAELGTVEWDTAKPHVMRLPLNSQAEESGDTDNIFYCYAYEAYFDKPLSVDSSFYIAGTFYNNVEMLDSIRLINYYPYLNTIYASVSEKRDEHGSCPTRYAQTYWSTVPPSFWESGSGGDYMEHRYGYFLPIVDRFVVTAEPDSLSVGMGEVDGGGTFWSGNPVTLHAIPYNGYRFFQWDDGNRDNPRIIIVQSDTMVTAEFIDSNTFEVLVTSEDEYAGMTEGTGMYNGSDTAIITATPFTDHLFVHWNDGDTANPRRIVVTQDTAFVAFFDIASRDTTGIATVEVNATDFFTLSPNPATGTVTVTVGHTPQSLRDSSPNLGEQLILTLADAAGREVLRKEFSIVNFQLSIPLDLSGLAAGTYYVTLTTPTATGTQRLVVR